MSCYDLLIDINKSRKLISSVSSELASFLRVVISLLKYILKNGSIDFQIIYNLSLFVNFFYEDPKLSFSSVKKVKKAIFSDY